VIEKVETFGGPSGLVSKAVREVAQSIYQIVSALFPDLAIKTRAEKLALFKTIWQRDFKMLKDDAVNFQAVETMMKFKKYGVKVYVGEATITKSNDAIPKIVVKVKSDDDVEHKLISTNLCIATGSTPNRPNELNSVAIPWGHDKMLDSEKIGNLYQLPVSLGIIGGGVIAAEYGESCHIPL
jgi:pyruvate/2-oxoglutarate dehydrogenase complex dihydrolipoamide dehydrogenase (E3) component